MKRQAARFRIYAYDEKGKNMGELPIRGGDDADMSSGASVVWSVHLANRKAAAFKFKAYEPSTLRRNPGTEDRQSLVIDPGKRTIAGRAISGVPYQFDTGCFRQKPVSLGEIRTDEHGRLLVLGGFGKSEPIVSGDPDPDRPITHYANNDDWHDDVSDGPVTATVTIPGHEPITVAGADGAWVIVAPPKFAPGIAPIVTLFDVVQDTAMRAGWLEEDDKIEYYRDIYPILLRTADTAWVNNRARIGHGYGKAGRYSRKYPPTSQNFKISRELLASPDLASPARVRENKKAGDPVHDLAKRIFCRLREPLKLVGPPDLPEEHVKPEPEPIHLPKDHPERQEWNARRKRAIGQANFDCMPALSGDGGDAEIDNPETWMSVLPRQYETFRRWSEGDFETGKEESWPAWGDMTFECQVWALQRAALEPCIGGAFYPGIEMTYNARWMKTFCGAFRIDQASHNPGDLTSHMALPWHADFYDCNTSWWPAQRPDDVVPQEVFDEANEAWREGPKVPIVSEALEGREKWDRGLGGNTLFRRPWKNPAEAPDDPRNAGIFARDDMVRYWSELGFVVPIVARSGELVHIEVDRRPFAGMDVRELFHALLNMPKHNACRPKAKEYVERVLDAARKVQQSATAFNFRDNIIPLVYDEQSFDARMNDIYDDSADFAFFTQNGNPEVYNPNDDKHNEWFRSREEVIYRIRQLTPFNFLDGAWLRNIHRVGPVDEVNSVLFFICKEELGDGVPSQNHANIYRDLCHSFGFYPPPVASTAFARDTRFLDAAFDSATFQLAISEFTEDYYPEIIGMSLWLEWTVLELHRIAAIVDRVGLNSHFYRMHIAIDNAENGHGAGIIRAVKLYLQYLRATGGDDRDVQRQWERIWDGYVAFSYTFTVLIMQIIFVIKRNRGDQNDMSRLSRLERGLKSLIRQKKAYGQYNHTKYKLGGMSLNQLFDDPDTFLKKLVDEKWIVRGMPEASPFFELLEFQGGRRFRERPKLDGSDASSASDKWVGFEGGRMYSVFTQEEIQLWRDWTRELGNGAPKQSVKLFDRLTATDVALAKSLADDLEKATSGHRIASWLKIAQEATAKARTAFPDKDQGFFSDLATKTVISRAKLWLGWGMVRALTHIAGQSPIGWGDDVLTPKSATGDRRTMAHWFAQIRSTSSPALCARTLLIALKSEFEAQQDRSPNGIITRLSTSAAWLMSLDLVVPGNDGKQVRDTMAAWIAFAAPIPEVPEGRLRPLRLDATLDEEEHHPTGVPLGFGTVH